MSNCQDIQKYLNYYLDNAPAAVEKQIVDVHLAGCAACRVYFESEKALEQKIIRTLEKPVERENAIWSQAVKSFLEAERNGEPVWSAQPRSIFRYLVPLASAAVIILAILPLLLFPPSVTPEIVQVAVQEHRSFLNNKVKFEVLDGSAEEITRYFKEKRNFGLGECCGAMLQKDDLELKGGRMLEVQKTPIVTINATYQNIPVT
ncbi:MAG: zf-HC2 domain-containing protein, partial [Planctomycetota bacterium]